MGEVYRAKDTKLGRDVAIKVLPASFTIDPERVGAFQDVSLPHYLPSQDGQRFLMDTVVEENVAPVNVILNWNPPSDRPVGSPR